MDTLQDWMDSAIVRQAVRRGDLVSKRGGRWMMLCVCAGVLIQASRFRSKAQAWRWGNRWRAHIPMGYLLLRRFRYREWREISAWEDAVQYQHAARAVRLMAGLVQRVQIDQLAIHAQELR